METPRISPTETHDVTAARRLTSSLVRMPLLTPEIAPEPIVPDTLMKRIAARALTFGQAWWDGTELFPNRKNHE